MSSMVTMYSAAGLFNPSSWGLPEMAIVFVIILIFFGPKRLPQLSRSIGKAITDFKRGLRDVKDDIEKAGDEEEEEQSRPAAVKAANSKKAETPAPPAVEAKHAEND